MSPSLTAFAYLIAGVLFVLALRGLSSPTSARQGNMFGMVGMAIAILATLARSGMSGGGFVLIIVAIAIGGGIGVTVSRRIQIKALTQAGYQVCDPFCMASCMQHLTRCDMPTFHPRARAAGLPRRSQCSLCATHWLPTAVADMTFSASMVSALPSKTAAGEVLHPPAVLLCADVDAAMPSANVGAALPLAGCCPSLSCRPSHVLPSCPAQLLVPLAASQWHSGPCFLWLFLTSACTVRLERPAGGSQFHLPAAPLPAG